MRLKQALQGVRLTLNFSQVSLNFPRPLETQLSLIFDVNVLLFERNSLKAGQVQLGATKRSTSTIQTFVPSGHDSSAARRCHHPQQGTRSPLQFLLKALSAFNYWGRKCSFYLFPPIFIRFRSCLKPVHQQPISPAPFLSQPAFIPHFPHPGLQPKRLPPPSSFHFSFSKTFWLPPEAGGSTKKRK